MKACTIKDKNQAINVCLAMISQAKEAGRHTELLRQKSMNNTYLVHYAAQQGLLDVVQKLCDFDQVKIQIELPSDSNILMLHWACESGNLALCQWLCEMGSKKKIRSVDDYGRTPMFVACEKGHLSVCKWLFAMGAKEDISKGNSERWTPMHVACKNGHLIVCQWLFEGAKADIIKADNAGRTLDEYCLL